MNNPSIRIFKLSKEAQAKIDDKIEYRDKIINFLHNDNLFRIGDTNVSYRNAVYLEKVGLLRRKESETGWRKLSLIDAVYFDILTELRGFGLTAKKLALTKDAFYGKTELIDSVFLATFYGYEMKLVIYNDGSGYIFDPKAYANYESNARTRINKPRIIMEINPFVNNALKILGMPTIKASNTTCESKEGGVPSR